MIGSPRSRGAVASVTGAGRACFGAAWAAGTVRVAIAARVTMAGQPRRRIAGVDRAVKNRIPMPFPGRKCLPALASILEQLIAATPP
jgi:hypothetical protein